MAKQRSMYICSECGYESGKWYGKCPGCGEWNTMNEETPAVKSTGHQAQQRRLCLATVETFVGNYRRRGAAYFHRYS